MHLSPHILVTITVFILVFVVFYLSMSQSIHASIIKSFLSKQCVNGPKITFNDSTHNPVLILGNDDTQPVATININTAENNFWSTLLLYSDVGLGEMYVSGEWNSPNLERTLCYFYGHFRSTSGNEDIWTRGFSKITGITKLVSYSKQEDKNRISHHYDVGNDFYDTFLKEDAFKAYSCGFYDSPECDLKRAQHNKVNLIIKKLDCQPGMKIADIGCGWGVIANYVAKQTQCHVSAINISEEQLKYINDTYSPEHVGIIQSDYRYLIDDKYANMFDRVYSIGMLEHVRYENLQEYFNVIRHILKPGGKAVIHTIISFPNTPKESVKDGTFITKHVFPGGQIPMHDWITNSIVSVTGLHISHTECFGGQHYSKTCHDWRELMFENMTDELRNKYGMETIRKYDYYLASSSAGFSVSIMGLGHFVIVKDERTPIVSIDGQYFPQI